MTFKHIYEVNCFPVAAEVLTVLPFKLFVVGENSGEVTKKAVKHIQGIHPELGVKAIEVISFQRIISGTGHIPGEVNIDVVV